MIYSTIVALLFILALEGFGTWTLDKLHIDKSTYHAPIGVALFFALYEAFAGPAIIFHAPFSFVKTISILLLAMVIVIGIIRIKDTMQRLLKPQSLFLVCSLFLFLFVFEVFDVNAILHTDPELIKMTSLTEGTRISFEQYYLQGYWLFGSFLSWLIPESDALVIYVLSILIHLISAMLYLNIINRFNIRNPWFKFTIVVCAIFYMNFYSWKIAGAFHPGNWRLVFAAMMLFVTYEWLRQGNEQIKYLLIIIIGAGLFTHDGFVMISLEILLSIAIYLFHEEKIRSLFDLTSFFIPLVAYWSYYLFQFNMWLGILLFVSYTIFIFARYQRPVRRFLWQAENYFIDYNYQIFFVGIPILMVILTLVYRIVLPSHSIPYVNYLSIFNTAPAKNYLFVHASSLDIVLDVIRWAGLILLVMNVKSKENQLIRYFYIIMLIVFINPLCMGIIAGVVGIEAYGYGFEALFNPFTDILIFTAIYRVFEWQTLMQWVLEIALIGCAILGQIGSYLQWPIGLYTDIVANSDKVIEVKR